MGAPVVAAVDEKPAVAGRPHFPESDFLFTRAKFRPVGARPIKARPGRLGPLGLAELMFLRSTPGRMGNLLIPITAPRNQIGLRRFVIWG
jgi:hypothetical protein